ncbi:MAG: hypothetical protein ACHREM_13600 [Polyangiales bacterium]
MATKKKLWSKEATASRKHHLHHVWNLPTAVEVAGALLVESHNNYGLAIRRITFYENRSGRNLGAPMRKRLDDAKMILRRAEISYATRVLAKRLHHGHVHV